MKNEIYSFALKSTLEEIQNICPNVSETFIFKDGKILAKNENANKQNTNSTINAFGAIAERADVIGGIEAVTIQGANGRVNIACMHDFYFTTVLSKEADEEYINTLTRVLIPTVIKLVEKICPASTDDETLAVNLESNVDGDERTDAENKTDEDIDGENADEADGDTDNQNDRLDKSEEENATDEPIEEKETLKTSGEALLPEPPVTQLIVENLGGLLVPSDTVRIDKAVITEWNDLYGDKQINEVNVETLDGITTRCKFKPIKSSKHQGKGIIRMPEKIQLTLETKKGELVMVKPVIE